MRYEAPQTIDAALDLLKQETGLACILAGGTDLIIQLRSDMVEPNLILDIKRIKSLKDITEEDGGFRIGAAVSGAELGEHKGVCALWPGVVEATELIGSTQIQGRATMVGNLCNASPAGDSVPALVAADATARIIGPKGSRDVPAVDIATAPGKTSLARDEFVESVFLPAREKNSADAYLRFIPRTEMDIAVVGCAVSLTLDKSGICTHARVALGAVAAKVFLVDAAADVLIKSKIDDAVVEKLGAIARAAATPIDDKRGTTEFRKKIAGVLAKRAAIIAARRARGEK